MEDYFNERERLFNYMVVHSMDHPSSIGLLTGQMGVVITITHYARKYGGRQLDNIADSLLSNILKTLPSMRDISFSSGLSGFCWGIEYLVQKGILPESADEICKKADGFICKTEISNINDFSLETGLLGLWNYIIARSIGNFKNHLKSPFPEDYLQSWADLIYRIPQEFPSDAPKIISSIIEQDIHLEALTDLSVKEFVNPACTPDTHDISLGTGIAGYIEYKYLS